MKSFLTAEEAKDIREIAENLRKKRRQESEKRYEDFLKTETGRAYKKYVEVFGVAPEPPFQRREADPPALAKMYLNAIENGVPLTCKSKEEVDEEMIQVAKSIMEALKAEVKGKEEKKDDNIN